MGTVKKVIDFICFVLIAIVIYLSIAKKSLFIPGDISKEELSEIISSLTQTITGGLASLLGILLAVYLIAPQITGKKPYSRLVRTLYNKWDIIYLLLFLITFLLPIYAQVFIKPISEYRLYFIIDVQVLLCTASCISLVSFLFKHLSIFNPKLVAVKVLNSFYTSNILRYGLVAVEKNTHDSNIKFKLKTWGHRHNLSDPLGAFHDILIEAIETKERITFHLYLSAFMEKIANLNGVHFKRVFGVAKGDIKWDVNKLFNIKLPIVFYNRLIEHKVQITVHGLHYLVRRSKKLTTEWGIDNHRQIFIINLCDLIISFSKDKSNAKQIEITLNAILRICIDYKEIEIHGSYEPLNDAFNLAADLRNKGFQHESNILIKTLAFIDTNTNYLSNNPSVNLPNTLDKVSPEIKNYFLQLKPEMTGKGIDFIFPENIWV
jgi:hypothetical protein